VCTLLQCSFDALFGPWGCGQGNESSVLLVVVQELAGRVEAYGGHVSEVCHDPIKVI